MHRAAGTLPTRTCQVAQLRPGESFGDAGNGIGITASTVDTLAGAATVAVSMSNAACATPPGPR